MTDKDAQHYIYLAKKALEMTDGRAEATRLLRNAILITDHLIEPQCSDTAAWAIGMALEANK